jgi:hypothetical protein
LFATEQVRQHGIAPIENTNVALRVHQRKITGLLRHFQPGFGRFFLVFGVRTRNGMFSKAASNTLAAQWTTPGR